MPLLHPVTAVHPATFRRTAPALTAKGAAAPVTAKPRTATTAVTRQEARLRDWAGPSAWDCENTPGPFSFAYRTNRNNLVDDLNSPRKRSRVNAEYVSNALDAIEHDGHEGALWAYNPEAFGHFGRAAVVVGDLEHADRVALLVPGMTNSVKTLPSIARSARELHRQCLEYESGSSVAVMAWMGYHAPAGGDCAEVSGWALAEAGARLLRRDVAELKEGWRTSRTRRGRGLPELPRFTVSAHSYGSATVGLAASLESSGLADALVFLGSPGVSVGRVEALNVGRENVFVGSSNVDPVTYLQAFGPDPSHRTFGANRFRADHRNHGFNVMADHSHYYDAGSDSLRNISRVVLGRTGEVVPQRGRKHALISLSRWATHRTEPLARPS